MTVNMTSREPLKLVHFLQQQLGMNLQHIEAKLAEFDFTTNTTVRKTLADKSVMEIKLVVTPEPGK